MRAASYAIAPVSPSRPTPRSRPRRQARTSRRAAGHISSRGGGAGASPPGRCRRRLRCRRRARCSAPPAKAATRATRTTTGTPFWREPSSTGSWRTSNRRTPSTKRRTPSIKAGLCILPSGNLVCVLMILGDVYMPRSKSLQSCSRGFLEDR